MTLTALVSLHLVCADYTTETWELRAGDNIIGCFNAPGLGTFDWNNCVGVPTGDGDVAGRCEDMCRLRSDGKTALVGLRACDEGTPHSNGQYLTNANGNFTGARASAAALLIRRTRVMLPFARPTALPTTAESYRAVAPRLAGAKLRTVV